MDNHFILNFLDSELHPCDALITHPHQIPQEPGIYAWYFREIPPQLINTSTCKRKDGLTLLYIGIVPKSEGIDRGLRDRIYGNHLTGNAENSTLRLSLGCLLGRQLGIQLRRVNNGNTFKFCTTDCHNGEIFLTEWLRQNAFVSWQVHTAPWAREIDLIHNLNLPLNIQHNSDNQNCSILKNIRKNCKESARALPIVNCN